MLPDFCCMEKLSSMPVQKIISIMDSHLFQKVIKAGHEVLTPELVKEACTAVPKRLTNCLRRGMTH